MSITAKITSKGQLTLPRKIRTALETNTVEIDLVEGEVRLRPVRNVAGALAGYAREKVSLDKVREKVWQEVADEKGR